MSKERARRRAERERLRALTAAERERREERRRRRRDRVARMRSALPALSALPRRTRWRGHRGLLAARRRAQNAVIAVLFFVVQAVAWFAVGSWLVSVAMLVLSVLALPVVVTLAFDRRSG